MTCHKLDTHGNKKVRLTNKLPRIKLICLAKFCLCFSVTLIGGINNYSLCLEFISTLSKQASLFIMFVIFRTKRIACLQLRVVYYLYDNSIVVIYNGVMPVINFRYTSQIKQIVKRQPCYDTGNSNLNANLRL